jgi:hypothetical protein
MIASSQEIIWSPWQDLISQYKGACGLKPMTLTTRPWMSLSEEWTQIKILKWNVIKINFLIEVHVWYSLFFYIFIEYEYLIWLSADDTLKGVVCKTQHNSVIMQQTLNPEILYLTAYWLTFLSTDSIPNLKSQKIN